MKADKNLFKDQRDLAVKMYVPLHVFEFNMAKNEYKSLDEEFKAMTRYEM